jgi:hypothetical protein
LKIYVRQTKQSAGDCPVAIFWRKESGLSASKDCLLSQQSPLERGKKNCEIRAPLAILISLFNLPKSLFFANIHLT